MRARWDDTTGDVKDVADDAREAVAYLLGMESYVYGYPLVMMDVTRDVLTAAPAANADGTAAPMNQLATNGTWSVSQYKGNFYERNVFNRYAIAPWTPLKFNADGSLDIYLQATSPGKDEESNWLPTPLGQFNLTLRNYFPKVAAYDGSYKVPPVKKVLDVTVGKGTPQRAQGKLPGEKMP